MLLLVTCTSALLRAQFPKTVLCAQNFVYEKIIIYDGLLWFLFLRPQTTVQLYMLGYYSSVSIRFNMNNKHHTLLTHHVSLTLSWWRSICRANQWTGFYMIGTSIMKELNTLSFNCYILFYSELNEVYSDYFWILKWVNLHGTDSVLLASSIFPNNE